jgi:hypothetical protein
MDREFLELGIDCWELINPVLVFYILLSVKFSRPFV